MTRSWDFLMTRWSESTCHRFFSCEGGDVFNCFLILLLDSYYMYVIDSKRDKLNDLLD